MAEKKKLSEKDKAHMLFKRLKAKMKLSGDELNLVKKYYPFLR